MAWVEVVEAFHWDPPEHGGRVTLVYEPGLRQMREACADHAVARGKGVRAKRPAAPRQAPPAAVDGSGEAEADAEAQGD